MHTCSLYESTQVPIVVRTPVIVRGRVVGGTYGVQGLTAYYWVLKKHACKGTADRETEKSPGNQGTALICTERGPMTKQNRWSSALVSRICVKVRHWHKNLVPERETRQDVIASALISPTALLPSPQVPSCKAITMRAKRLPKYVRPGKSLNIRIVVRSTLSTAVTNARLISFLPPGVTYVSSRNTLKTPGVTPYLDGDRVVLEPVTLQERDSLRYKMKVYISANAPEDQRLLIPVQFDSGSSRNCSAGVQIEVCGEDVVRE